MFPFKSKASNPVQQKKSYTFAEYVNDCRCTSTYTDLTIRQSILLYLATPPIRKAVDLISSLGSTLAPIVRDKKSNEVQEKHEALLLLENTSFGISFKEFMGQACINYLVTGNNYFLLTKSALGKPLQLFNVSPVEVTMSISNGKVTYYERTIVYQNAGSESKLITRYNREETVVNGFRVAFVDVDGNELWHMKEYNPLNPSMGKSKISTLDDSANGFNVAGQHNRKLIENGCSPSGILINKGELADEEYSNVQENFRQKFTGAKNAGAPLLLEGDMDFKELHISPREMDWINGRKFDEKLIYDVYGVPQALVENKASSFNNLSTSMFMLYEYTEFPLLDKIYGELTDLLMFAYKNDKNLEIYYSKENIPSLDAIKTESTLNKSKTGIYTIDELRTANGLEELPNSEGKVLLSAGKPQTNEEPPEDAKSEFSRLMQKDGYNNKQIKARIEEFEKEGLL